MSKTIVNELKNIIANELDVNLKVEAIDENISLFEEGLALDSISLVELISSVEQHFDFQFNDGELSPENFNTLNILAKFINSKISSSTSKTAS